MARRNKPQNPLEQRRRDFEAVGLQREAASLPQHSDVQITREAEDRDGKQVDHNVARRSDAFDALRSTMEPGAYDAARWLEKQLLIRSLEGDREVVVSRERVDCERNYVPAWVAKVVDAGRAVDEVRARLSRRDYWLLLELIRPSRQYDRGWRGAVAYVTGEENPNAQGAAVRAACVNLRDAREAMDEKGRKAA